MATTTYTDNVEILGSRDINQLKVKGFSSQTTPLQEWHGCSGSSIAAVKNNGNVGIGTGILAGATDARLVVEAVKNTVNLAIGPSTTAAGAATTDVFSAITLRGESVKHAQLQYRPTSGNGTVVLGGSTSAADTLGVTQAIDISLSPSGGSVGIGTLTPSAAKLEVNTATATTKGVLVKATASQSANLTEWQDSSSNVTASVNQNGMISGSMDTMTFASPMTLDVTKPNLHKTTATANATIDASGPGTAGQHIWILIANDATARTITWGTYFKPSSATLVGTANKSAMVQFVSDGSYFWEVKRTLSL